MLGYLLQTNKGHSCKLLNVECKILFNDLIYSGLYSGLLLYLRLHFLINAKIVFNSFNCSSSGNKCK